LTNEITTTEAERESAWQSLACYNWHVCCSIDMSNLFSPKWHWRPHAQLLLSLVRYTHWHFGNNSSFKIYKTYANFDRTAQQCA